MPKRYSPREVAQILERDGFTHERTRGSHARLVKSGNKVTVPLYRRELPPKTLISILKQAGMSRLKFEKLAREVL